MAEDTLVVRVEGGDPYYESHTGDWLSEGRLEALCNVFPDDIGPILDEDDGVQAAIRASKEEDRVFLVTMHDMAFVPEPGYWDLNWGYVAPDYYIESNGLIEVKEIKSEDKGNEYS